MSWSRHMFVRQPWDSVADSVDVGSCGGMAFRAAWSLNCHQLCFFNITSPGGWVSRGAVWGEVAHQPWGE